MSARVENATLQLYEEPGLREDLIDDEATLMLEWAEGEVARIDSRSEDDAAFEEAFGALRRLLKTINRLIGQGAFITPEEQAAQMEKIAEYAGTLGYAMPSERQTAFLQSQADADNLAALSSLLAMIDGSADALPPTDLPPDDDKPSPLQRLGQFFRAQSPTGTTHDTDVNIEDSTPSGDING